MRIGRLDLQSGQLQFLKELKPVERSGVMRVNSVALTPDGRSLAYSYARHLSNLYVVTGLR